MRIETFFEKFELFSDAPDAVVKLRELIFALAFTGHLPGDAGQTVAQDEWTLKTFDEICESMQPGFACSKSHQTPDGHVHLRTHNISTLGTLNFDLVIRINPDKVDPSKASLRKGDILFNNTNSQELVGKTALVDRDYDHGFSNHLTRLRVNISTWSPYVVYYLTHLRNSGYFARLCTRWIGQAAINTKTLRAQQIPLPPLAEQKRIVAKVDELMALCDRLEAQQKEREAKHATLARAALARFADAPTPKNLEYLFHPAYNIDPADIRNAILSLAVRGKLVVQHPQDEPVTELISRIEKKRKGAKARKYGEVSLEERFYEVPASWTWVRMGNVALSSDSGWSPQCQPSQRSGEEWGVLKVSAVTWGDFRPEENKALPPGAEARLECEVRDGDFLLSRANTANLVARSVVVKKPPPRLMMSDKIVRFNFPDDVDARFINFANLSDRSRDYYARNASGTSNSMKNVGRDVMCNLPLPLPPLAEQRRIVAKVDELTSLVDKLETQLAAARTIAEKLLTAAVAELTSAN